MERSDPENATVLVIKDYMSRKKKEADKEVTADKARKKKEENKRKDKEGSFSNKRNKFHRGGQGRGYQGRGFQGGRGYQQGRGSF